MIDELKKGMKLIKYGFNLKSSVMVAVLFFIMGIVFICMDHETCLLGGIYIMLGPMMLIQIYRLLICSNMVAASPKKRVLEMWIPNLAGLAIVVLSYIFMIVMTMFKIKETPSVENDCLGNLVCMGVLAFLLIVYVSITYKKFVISVILFCVTYSLAYSVLSDILHTVKIHMTIVTVSLAGFCFIIFGFILSLVLSKVFYKKPMSKYAVGGKLRQYM